jgi:hypothetical protein
VQLCRPGHATGRCCRACATRRASFAQWLRDNLASKGSRPSALVVLLRLAADCADEPARRVPLALSLAQHMGLGVTELELRSGGGADQPAAAPASTARGQGLVTAARTVGL